MDCLIFCLLSNEYKNELQNIFSRAFDCYEICNLIFDLFLDEQNNYMSLSYIVRFFLKQVLFIIHILTEFFHGIMELKIAMLLMPDPVKFF